MARGFNVAQVSVDAPDNRAIVPIGQVLQAEGSAGLGERIYITWIEMNVVSTGGAGTVAQLTDGAGGFLVAQMDMSVNANSFYRNYVGALRNFAGRALSPGNPLYANVTGGRVAIEVGYEVR